MVQKKGFLTPQQLEVLRHRLEGKSQDATAASLGTTRQNISLIERRAHRNIRRSEETIIAYNELMKAASFEIKPGTHLIDVPRLVVDKADEVGIRLRADFTRIYNEFKFLAPGYVDRTKVMKPVKVLLLKNGDIKVIPV